MVKLEDASELRLGDEFDKETCLSNAEVAVLLAEAKRKYEEEDRAVPEVFEQTLAYCNRFSQIKDPVTNKAVVDELRKELEEKTWDRIDANGEREQFKLKQFEMVAAMNLKLEDKDEVSALVPTLHNRLDENDLDDLLDKINRASRDFQG